MTIPQGDARSANSVNERRKVTFATDCACSDAFALPSPPLQEVDSKLPPDISTEKSDCLTSDTIQLPGVTPELKTTPPDHHLEVNVNIVPGAGARKSPLPLLKVPREDRLSSSSESSRKLSLNLATPDRVSTPVNHRLRRQSAPQKSAYQRLPQDEPSPLSATPPSNPSSAIFTLPQSYESPEQASAHKALVNASFRPDHVINNDRDHSHVDEDDDSVVDDDVDDDAKVEKNVNGAKDKKPITIPCPINRGFVSSTSPRQAGNKSKKKPTGGKTQKTFFGKQRALSPASSNSSKSLDDLTFIHHHGARGARRLNKSGTTNRSASSDDLSVSRRIRPTPPSGPSRRQLGDPHPSPGSPTRCCLVSVSRVPMAAATSHLTLDSEYQTVRLAVLGAPGVGKSAIVRQFVLQQFLEEYVPTEQRQVFCPAVIINEHLYEVRIMDCPYIPYFPVNSLYEWTDFRGYGLRNATAYLLVYDITSEESFEYIKSLRLQILESRNRHDVPIFVVGNKHDLAEERGVPRREVANLVKKQWKCGYIECSAKYNWHIMLLFKELMKTVDYIDYGHKPTSMRVQDALRRNRCLIL